MLFGLHDLEEILRAPQGTAATAELVFAYMRHAPQHANTCLQCLTQLPVLGRHADEVMEACRAPLSAAKLRCLKLYLPDIDVPKVLLDDMVYAMRFSPDLAELVIELLPHVDAEDDMCAIEGLTMCLHDSRAAVRLAAVQVLRQLCTQEYYATHYLLPNCGAIVADPQYTAAHSRLLLHLVLSVPIASDTVVHALPIVVARGPSCPDSTLLVHELAHKHPRTVVRQGGLTMMLLAEASVPREIMRLYLQSAALPQGDDEVLAYMYCRLELPSNYQGAMLRAFRDQPAPVRALYAETYVGARGLQDNPSVPRLPDFDVAHTGTVEMVDAAGETCTGLLGPLARASAFIEARARHPGPHSPLSVPLAGETVLRALCYDELPEDTESLVVLAELGNMWCAPALVHHCITRLVQRASFWVVMDLAGQWEQARGLLCYHALERLVTLAKHERAPELADMLWTCR